MRKIFYLIVFIFLIGFLSCKKKLNLDNLRFNEAEYIVSIHKINGTSVDSLIYYKIPKNSEKITFLKDWLSNNNYEWNKSIASYAIPEYSLTSENFRLLIFENFVVLGFTDSTGKSYQYKKQVDKSELVFLVKRENEQGDSESFGANNEVEVKQEYLDRNKLMKVFSEIIKTFPADSASLYRFYFKSFPAKTPEKIQKQIERLEVLLTNESIDKYREVENNLKLLLSETVKKKTLNCSQLENLVTLYSDYDYFSGEALFSQLLSNDENYSLVWESFRIVAKESYKDTCYIAALIELDKNIMTNAELSEAMTGFIIEAIKNNNFGFLDMYSARTNENRVKFANYISHYDLVDKELLSTFTEISRNEKNEKYRQAAYELIQNFND